MYVQTIFSILLLSFCVWALENSIKFRKIYDCKGNPGCSEDIPFHSEKGIDSSKRCAIHCIRRASCVSFNYWRATRLCQLFDFLPYKIKGSNLCTHYQSDPKIRYLKNENLAEYRQTCQSATGFVGGKVLYSWFAVDGLLLTDVNTGFCAHTNHGDSGNNWFMVDLMYTVKIVYVRVLASRANIYFRIRYKNLTIGTTNDSWLIKTPNRTPINYSICGIYLGPLPSDEWFEVYCQAGTPSARYVIVHQMPADPIYGGYLCLCEFQVFGDF